MAQAMVLFLDHRQALFNNLHLRPGVFSRHPATYGVDLEMKPEELSEFRALLKILRARIRGDVEQLQEEAFSGAEAGGDQRSSNHMAEMGSDAWDLEFSLQLVESDQGVLDEINYALKKLDDGSYGLCEMCTEQGKPESRARIPRARLQVIPYARNCIECEREKEKRR